MVNVRALLRGTAEEDLQKLEDKARELGRTGLHSATQVAGAIGQLASAGLNHEQILNGALQATADAATATGSTIDETAVLITGLISTFDLPLDQIGNVANRLVGLTDISKLSLNDLSQALSQAGPSAAKAGISLDQLISITGILGRTLKSGSEAGTSLTAMLNGIINQAGSTVEEQKKIVDGTTDIREEVAKNVEFFDVQTKKVAGVFGDLWGDDVGDVIGLYGKNITIFAGTEKDFNAKVEEAFEKSKDLVQGWSADQKDIIRQQLADFDSAFGDAPEAERKRIIERFLDQRQKEYDYVNRETDRLKQEAQAKIDAQTLLGYDGSSGGRVDFSTALGRL